MAEQIKLTRTGKTINSNAAAGKPSNLPAWVAIGTELSAENKDSVLKESGSSVALNKEVTSTTEVEGLGAEKKSRAKGTVTVETSSAMVVNDTMKIVGETMECKAAGKLKIIEVGLFDGYYKSGTYGASTIKTGSAIIASSSAQEFETNTNMEESEGWKVGGLLQIHGEVVQIESITTPKVKFKVTRKANGYAESNAAIAAGDPVTYGTAPGPQEVVGTAGAIKAGSVLYARASLAPESEVLTLNEKDTVTYTWKIKFE